MGHIQRNPYTRYKVKRVEGNRDFLTLKQLKKIEQKKFSISRLELVKDLFVFACYTGLSYSDIYKLSFQHIQIGSDGENWIIIDRNKNNSRCRIPLLPSAKQIIQKYSDHPVCSQRGTVLPILSNQKMNAYLKEIADLCGISKNLSMHVARYPNLCKIQTSLN
jgi:integrase